MVPVYPGGSWPLRPQRTPAAVLRELLSLFVRRLAHDASSERITAPEIWEPERATIGARIQQLEDELGAAVNVMVRDELRAVLVGELATGEMPELFRKMVREEIRKGVFPSCRKEP